MYEVFLNERQIVITRSGNIPFIKEVVKAENLHSIEEVKSWFVKFTNAETGSVILLHPTPEVFWKDLFLPVLNSIPAAGGVVIRDNKLLFIFRNEKWDLPKGKIDPGESIEEAATREVAEECGITGHKIIAKLPSTFHIYQSPWKEYQGRWILKETHWFEMNYQGSKDGTPETNENITKIRWFAKNELDEVIANTYENLKSVISIYKGK
jgi:8-oxo-dGTP pyrophosphatase MutT (NUDIX family)